MSIHSLPPKKLINIYDPSELVHSRATEIYVLRYFDHLKLLDVIKILSKSLHMGV